MRRDISLEERDTGKNPEPSSSFKTLRKVTHTLFFGTESGRELLQLLHCERESLFIYRVVTPRDFHHVQGEGGGGDRRKNIGAHLLSFILITRSRFRVKHCPSQSFYLKLSREYLLLILVRRALRIKEWRHQGDG